MTREERYMIRKEIEEGRELMRKKELIERLSEIIYWYENDLDTLAKVRSPKLSEVSRELREGMREYASKEDKRLTAKAFNDILSLLIPYKTFENSKGKVVETPVLLDYNEGTYWTSSKCFKMNGARVLHMPEEVKEKL